MVAARPGLEHPEFAAWLRAGETLRLKTMHPTSRGVSLHLAHPGASHACVTSRGIARIPIPAARRTRIPILRTYPLDFGDGRVIHRYPLDFGDAKFGLW